MKSSFGIFLLLGLSLACIGTQVKTDFKDLNFLEKLLILSIRPNWEDFPVKAPSDLVPFEYNMKHGVFAEAPAAFLQLAKLGNKYRIPDWFFMYDFDFDYCYYGCFGFHYEADWRDNFIEGADSAKLSASHKDSKLEITFDLPLFRFVSYGLTINVTDTINWDYTVNTGFLLYIKNLTWSLTADTKLVPGVGLQVSNVDLTYKLEECRNQFLTETTVYPNGTVVEKIPEPFKQEEGFLAWWADDEENTEGTIEHWLNCFLSNGRVAYEDKYCERIITKEGEMSTFVMILQALALGQHTNLFGPE